MSVLDLALQLAGLPQAYIDDMDDELPALARLANAMKKAEPLLTEAKPHVDALAPLVSKLFPIFQSAWPDIVSVTPTVDEYIAFLQSKQQQAAAPQE